MDAVTHAHESSGQYTGTCAFDEERCAALCAMAQLLAYVYREPFNDERIAFFRELDLEDENDLFMGNESCKAGARLVKRHFSSEDLEAARISASNDFHKLFVGPDRLLAKPWSSCYIDKKGVFGPTERQVAEAFRRQGLEIPEGRREPSDHVAYELQFLAEMHKRALEALNDESAGEGVSDGSLAFLQEAASFKARYIDTWFGMFLNDVEKGARADVYKGVALMTRGFLELETSFLAQLDLGREVA